MENNKRKRITTKNLKMAEKDVKTTLTSATIDKIAITNGTDSTLSFGISRDILRLKSIQIEVDKTVYRATQKLIAGIRAELKSK